MKYLSVISIFVLAVFFTSCNNKPDIKKTETKTGFAWSENLSLDEIPDTPLKGMLNGKEIKFDYINYETWRGSGDNVINFGDKKPDQSCGFVDNDNAIHLTRKAGNFIKGEFVKDSFSKNSEGITAEFHYTVEANMKKVTVPWNCALEITEIGEKTAKGKIAICFKDEAKSWIAGTFEAVICTN